MLGFALGLVFDRRSIAIDGPIKDRYDRVIAIFSRCVQWAAPSAGPG